MNNEIIKINSSYQLYIDKNREKLDEALVSLRLMKEVDSFLDENSISNKELAYSLGCSESFISQLMSGSKKINTSFINKFEKIFSVKIIFSIDKQEKEEKYKTIPSDSFLNFTMKGQILNNQTNPSILTFSSNEYTEYELVDENSY